MKHSEIDLKLIKEQYPSLKVWSDTHTYEIYKKIEEHQLINEFLYTVDGKKTVDQLNKQLGSDIGYVNFQTKNEKVSKILFTFKGVVKDHLEEVNKLFDKFGWYPSYVRADGLVAGKYSKNINTVLDYKNVTIAYEAKYDQEVALTSDYAYHITPDLKWPKIKAFGLTPKTQGKLADHPGRIYLITDLNSLEAIGGNIEEVAFALLDAYPHKDRVKDVFLLRIDLKQLKNHKFFDDPNFLMGAAVWTYKNIPPSAIKVIDKIDTTE